MKFLLAGMLAVGTMLAIPTQSVAADEKPTEEQVTAIMEMLASMRCEMDPDDIELEDGEFDLDDVICGGGQFDFKMNAEFAVTGARGE